MHRVKIVFFTVLGLGAAALVAEQPSVSAPIQQPGAQPAAPQATPSAPTQPPGIPSVHVAPPSAYPQKPPAHPAVLPAAARFLARIAVFAMDPRRAGGKAVPI